MTLDQIEITNEKQVDLKPYTALLQSLEEYGVSGVEVVQKGEEIAFVAAVTLDSPIRGGRVKTFTFDIRILASCDPTQVMGTLHLVESVIFTKKNPDPVFHPESQWIAETPQLMDDLIEWMDMIGEHIRAPLLNHALHGNRGGLYRFYDSNGSFLQILD